ncbi:MULTISPECIES: hypothetical protein [unclassified Streptomyces]|uniref:hypothetical protein n=1 Tax=unclassified Streptomyces TaxID=2593676 RepID=UPI002E183E77|nr:MULTISPECIES: hypothetical protein [unclassified Streptomyces]
MEFEESVRSSGVSRRRVARLGLGVGLGAAAGALAGCGTSGGEKASPPPAGPARHPERPAKKKVLPRLIGDGSTSYTGRQPKQPAAPTALEPGQTPPQFVVFSWDGAGEVGNGLFPRFLELARQHDARMTFFLSGLYLLPEAQKRRYQPPGNPVGASDIGYLSDPHLKETLRSVHQAWLDGHEIGTHFNGHFCGGSGSVGNWSPKQWRSEIEQARTFVKSWRTHTGWHDQPALPFDYDKELIGGRTPCLLGQENLLPVARELGWRYDASSPGGLQRWPEKRHGIWDLPLQGIPFPGHSFEVLSMDYNILANQSKNSTRAPAYNYPGWRTQATQAYLTGFQRAYETNRAPFFIGNHFEEWNGGIYMDAVEEALKRIADKAGSGDVRLVSFRQFVDWLDAQDPAVLAQLRDLQVGERPAGGWNRYLRPSKSPAKPGTTSGTGTTSKTGAPGQTAH